MRGSRAQVVAETYFEIYFRALFNDFSSIYQIQAKSGLKKKLFVALGLSLIDKFEK